MDGSGCCRAWQRLIIIHYRAAGQAFRSAGNVLRSRAALSFLDRERQLSVEVTVTDHTNLLLHGRTILLPLWLI